MQFCLTHFKSMFYFYTPWKSQKTFGFLVFSGGKEMEHWVKMGCNCVAVLFNDMMFAHN